MSEIKFRFDKLSKLDKLELGDAAGIEYAPTPLSGAAHGEPVTFIATITMAALPLIAAFLLRKHDGRSFEETYEEIRPDGTAIRKTVKYKAHSSQAPEAEIMRQLRSGATADVIHQLGGDGG